MKMRWRSVSCTISVFLITLPEDRHCPHGTFTRCQRELIGSLFRRHRRRADAVPPARWARIRGRHLAQGPLAICNGRGRHRRCVEGASSGGAAGDGPRGPARRRRGAERDDRDALKPQAAPARLVAAARECAASGAGTVILGWIGMAHHRAAIEDALGVPVIEPCQAAGIALAAMQASIGA
jgi:hypothetical protein